jgi:hypothetical protein
VALLNQCQVNEYFTTSSSSYLQTPALSKLRLEESENVEISSSEAVIKARWFIPKAVLE